MTNLPTEGAIAAGPDEELLQARRRWFASFPDGTLEFVAAARVVCIVLMFVTPIGGAGFRNYGLLGIAAVLLADGGMTMLWLSELCADRRRLVGNTADGSRAAVSPWLTSVIAILCHAALLLALVSYRPLPFAWAQPRPAVLAVVRWALLAAFVVLAAVLYYAVRRTTGTRRGAWALLTALPVLGWPAMRRLAFEAGDAFSREPSGRLPRGATVAADVLGVLFVVAMAATLRSPDLWMRMSFGAAAASFLFALAAIADMAALEGVHHAYLRYLNRSR